MSIIVDTLLGVNLKFRNEGWQISGYVGHLELLKTGPQVCLND